LLNTARWRLALEPHLLSLLRIVVGLLYMEHGFNKLFDFPPTPTHRPYHLFSLVPGVAGLLESFGGALITVGFYTRLVGFILSGEMAVAYFRSWAPRGFWPITNGGEFSTILAFAFLWLVAAGPGPWSLDYLIQKTFKRASPELAMGSAPARI